MNEPKGVIPYLTVADGEAAIAFYKNVFGATELFRHLAEDGKRLMHARLSINGGILMLSDDFPEMFGGKPRTPQPGQPRGVMLAVHLPEVDPTFDRAIEAGATALMPPADMFWGERYCQLADPFGHHWSLSAPLAKAA